MLLIFNRLFTTQAILSNNNLHSLLLFTPNTDTNTHTPAQHTGRSYFPLYLSFASISIYTLLRLCWRSCCCLRFQSVLGRYGQRLCYPLATLG